MTDKEYEEKLVLERAIIEIGKKLGEEERVNDGVRHKLKSESTLFRNTRLYT